MRGSAAQTLLALLLLLAVPPAVGDDRAQKIEADKAAEKARAEEAKRQEGSILDALDEIDRSVQQKEETLDQLKVRQQDVEKRIAALELERNKLEAELASRRVQLQKRMRALYKYSTRGFMQALFAGGSSTEIMKRTKYLQLIVRRDMELIQAQRAALLRLEALKLNVEKERQEVASLTAEVAAQVQAAQEERGKKNALLKSVRGEQVSAARALRELELAAAALARRVEALPMQSHRVDAPALAPTRPSAPIPAAIPPGASLPTAAASSASTTATTGNTPSPIAPDTRSQVSNESVAQAAAQIRQAGTFGAQQGRLTFPVEGAKITRRYGKYREEGMKAYDFHRGLDITAPMGAPIRAIGAGEVKLAEWFKGYGQLIIIDHGDGYHSIYAHASKLLKKAGDSVKAGERIALVGDTGSFQGPYLYFEIREKGKPVDPMEWLKVPASALAAP
jgi:septal ring factor EnvC (AmiA/AmiB activator)